MRVTCRIGESGDLEGLLDQTIETRVTVASRLCLSVHSPCTHTVSGQILALSA